ncbi:hypothetical protein [Micromonospora avicenniae]
MILGVGGPEFPPGVPDPVPKAGVREISVHTTRRTCASLLVALDIHPG